MNSFIGFTLLAILLMGCVEPYKFNIKNDKPALVVEGYISDVSFLETLDYPSDGRYFTVSLRYTSDVANANDKVETNAIVTLIDDAGESWIYTHAAVSPGKYVLESQEFEVQPERQYQLHIVLPNGNTYESDWEQLPATVPNVMGNIDFKEVDKQMYVIKAGEREVETVKGINVQIEIPGRVKGAPAFYRWEYEPTWIYIAPLARPSQPVYKCWATSKGFLPGYALQEDYVGGYKKDLFFMEAIRNERIFESLSVLVKQYSMSESYYYFWKEMQDQAEGGFINDTPPFNLQTNLKALNSEDAVFGYFGVVNENAKRWYFSRHDLSYFVDNTLKADCEVGYGGPPAESCLDCLAYTFGQATNIQPVWWETR